MYERPPIAGRQVEKAILKDALESGKAELIAIYGRRRVGKTFLVRSYYADNLKFELTGRVNASREIQGIANWKCLYPAGNMV